MIASTGNLEWSMAERGGQRITISMQAPRVMKRFVLDWSTVAVHGNTTFTAMAGSIEVGRVIQGGPRWKPAAWALFIPQDLSFDDPVKAMACLERAWLSKAPLPELRTLAATMTGGGDHKARWTCGLDGIYTASHAGVTVAKTRIPGFLTYVVAAPLAFLSVMGLPVPVPALDLPGALEDAERGWLVRVIRLHAALAMTKVSREIP